LRLPVFEGHHVLMAGHGLAGPQRHNEAPYTILCFLGCRFFVFSPAAPLKAKS